MIKLRNYYISNVSKLIQLISIKSKFQGFSHFFRIIFEKKDQQIVTSLSFKISPILPQNVCDPEPDNLTEVWTQLKKTASKTYPDKLYSKLIIM